MKPTFVENDDLDSLPNRAVIKTEHGIYVRNKPRLFPDEWCWLKQGNIDSYPRLYLNRPAEVLYNPIAAGLEDQAANQEAPPVGALEEAIASGLSTYDWAMYHADEGLASDAVEKAIRASVAEALYAAAEGVAVLAEGKGDDWERGLEEACTFLFKLSGMAR
jgi:hypothetical protein